jgi:hypothetical protein
MSARPQGYWNKGYNPLALDEWTNPALRNPSDSQGGTLLDIGTSFSTPDMVPARGAQDGHIPVAVLVIVALAYLVATQRLGISGLHLRVG